VLTTCQPSTVWCSRERLPAAAAQPAKVRQSCSATDLFINSFIRNVIVQITNRRTSLVSRSFRLTPRTAVHTGQETGLK
jgi:hypothetical protein